MTEQIERLAKQSGGFGCYMCLAHEWANPEATKRSYELIAQRVFPEFQGHAADGELEGLLSDAHSARRITLPIVPSGAKPVCGARP